MYSRVSFIRSFNILIACMIFAVFFINPAQFVFANDKSSEKAVTASQEEVVSSVETAVASPQAAVASSEAAIPSVKTDVAPADGVTAKDLAEVLAEKTSNPVNEAANPKYQPKVVIGMLGQEFNIKVLYDHPMDYANNDFIESIQMETMKGDFLGLATFGPNSKEAYTEFMVNPTLADFDEVMLIAKSSKVGDIKTHVKLEVTEQTELNRPLTEKKTRPLPKAAEKKENSKEKSKSQKKFHFF